MGLSRSFGVGFSQMEQHFQLFLDGRLDWGSSPSTKRYAPGTYITTCTHTEFKSGNFDLG